MKTLEDFQKLGRENMDATMKSIGAVTKSLQAIAAETTDYSKKSFEHGTAAAEKLMAAKSLDKVIEVQSDYVKTAYEAYVAESTKVGEMLADLAKETYKPFEMYMLKTASAK